MPKVAGLMSMAPRKMAKPQNSIEKLWGLAAESIRLSRTAARAKQSLCGSNLYAQKFHGLCVLITRLGEEVLDALPRQKDVDAITKFRVALRDLALPSTKPNLR